MERPAAGSSSAVFLVAAAVGVSLMATAVVVQAVWWWLERYNWGNDFQGTYEELHERLADPWFWSVEAVGAGVVVLVAVTALVWGLRLRAWRVTTAVLVAALIALGQMASFRLLLPSRADTRLPTIASGDCCSEPSGEMAVVDAGLPRGVGLAIVMGALVLVAGPVAERRAARRRVGPTS